MNVFFPELKIKQEQLDYEDVSIQERMSNSSEGSKVENTLKKDELTSLGSENIKPSCSRDNEMAVMIAKYEAKMKGDKVKEFFEEACLHGEDSSDEAVNFDEATPSSPLRKPPSPIPSETSNTTSNNERSPRSVSVSSAPLSAKKDDSMTKNNVLGINNAIDSYKEIVLPAKYRHLVEILIENKSLTHADKVMEVECILKNMEQLIHKYNCLCTVCRNVGCGKTFTNAGNRKRHQVFCAFKPDTLAGTDQSTSDPLERQSKRTKKTSSIASESSSLDSESNAAERRSKRPRKPKIMFENINIRSLNKVIGEPGEKVIMENPMEQQLKDDQEADEEAIIEEPNIDPASSGKCGFGLRLRKKASYDESGSEYGIIKDEEDIIVDEEVTIKEEEFEESSESEAEIVGETPQSTRKVRDANLCPGRKLKEVKSGLWNTNKKKKCVRVKLVVNQDQFSYKKIYPYHLYKPALETSYHNPMPWTEPDNARNVFNMMISDITNLSRLVPVMKDRRAYKTDSVRLRKNLDKNRLKVSHISGVHKDTSVEVHKTARKKIKVITPGSARSKDNTLVRRTKTCGTRPNFNILEHASPLLSNSTYQKKRAESDPFALPSGAPLDPFALPAQVNLHEQQYTAHSFGNKPGPKPSHLNALGMLVNTDDVPVVENEETVAAQSSLNQFDGPPPVGPLGPIYSKPGPHRVQLAKHQFTTLFDSKGLPIQNHIPAAALRATLRDTPALRATLPAGAYFRTKDGKLIRLETKPGAVQAALSSASVKQIVPNVTITARKKGEDGVKDPVKAILVPKGTTNKVSRDHVIVDAMLADNARLLVEAKEAAEVKKSEAAAKLASEAKKIFELSSYDAPIAPSQSEVLDQCVAEDEISVRRMFPNNQNTGLNLLKSMRPANKVVTVEKPVDRSYDFSISESDGHCDYATDTISTERTIAGSKCSSTSTIFTNKDLSGAAFGPCFTVCKTHLMGAGHARNNEIVLKNNKLTRYVYDTMHKHKSSTHETGTQTSEDKKLLDELFEVDLREASEDRTSLRAANKLLAEEMKSLKSANYTYSQRIKDFDQELSIEKELREFLKKENEDKDLANQKLTDELTWCKKQLEQLREQKKEATEEADAVKQENINYKLSTLDKSDTEVNMIEELKRETRYLTKQASIKDKKIKTLQVSVTSISGALRQQTKTVCDLSRKSNTNVTPEEDSKHKVYVGFESLVKITCNVLGSLQKENEQKIEEPEAMKKLCQMVSGDENLFSLFRKIFSKEGEEEEDEDKEGVEKRVLFLINLMSYFYSGADESPSSSGLKTLL